jgi:hypothetical protein
VDACEEHHQTRQNRLTESLKKSSRHSGALLGLKSEIGGV